MPATRSGTNSTRSDDPYPKSTTAHTSLRSLDDEVIVISSDEEDKTLTRPLATRKDRSSNKGKMRRMPTESSEIVEIKVDRETACLKQKSSGANEIRRCKEVRSKICATPLE